jgi:hypothetical protein
MTGAEPLCTTVIRTVESEGAQGGLLMVHRNRYSPAESGVKTACSSEVSLKVATELGGEETMLHVPAPGVAAFPWSVVSVPLHNVMGGPALASGAPSVTVTVTEAVLEPQGALLTVQTNVKVPTPVGVKETETLDCGTSCTGGPLVWLQAPEPVPGGNATRRPVAF